MLVFGVLVFGVLVFGVLVFGVLVFSARNVFDQSFWMLLPVARMRPIVIGAVVTIAASFLETKPFQYERYSSNWDESSECGGSPVAEGIIRPLPMSVGSILTRFNELVFPKGHNLHQKQALPFRTALYREHWLVFPSPNKIITDMNAILSVKTAQSHSTKDWLKISLGRTLACMFPSRTEELERSPTNYTTNRRDQLLMAFLRDRARLRDDTRFFEALHREFWSGDGGAVFSKNCDHRFEEIFLNQQKQEFSVLKSTWEKGSFDKIVEVGCCSGLLLQFLTANLPKVTSAVGIDINKPQIDANKKNSIFDSRIEFLCADGFEYISSNAKPQTLFVTNGGVLEYFSREQLDQMLVKLAAENGDSLFFCVEPVAPDHDWKSTRDSIPFGQELSFSHNYRDVFESNGYDVLHQRHVDFESWRWMATIAQTSGLQNLS